MDNTKHKCVQCQYLGSQSDRQEYKNVMEKKLQYEYNSYILNLIRICYGVVAVLTALKAVQHY